MIKEIFLPEKIGALRIYSQRFLGIAIENEIVSCAVVYAKRKKTIVEKLIKEKIEQGSQQSYNERAAKAIQKILSQAGEYDQIKIAVPASLVVFKEIDVPFKEPDKIRMILDYEIESMLPFSIDEAITDFIITRQEKDENKSQILVAAIRKNDLQGILDIYTAAQIEPTNITIDLFSTYNLYQQIPEYNSIKGCSAIINLASISTRVAFLQDGELRLTRIIPRGIVSIAKIISDETKTPLKKIEEKIKKYGIDPSGDTTFDKSLEKHTVNFFHDIQFTLNSFSLKLTTSKGINKILFTGPNSQIKGLTRFCKNLLQIPCESFACEKIFSNKLFKNKVGRFFNNWTTYIISLGTAIPPILKSEFSFRRKSFALPYHNIIGKQLYSAMIIIIAMFAIIFTRGYMHTNKLSKMAEKIEKREMEELRKIFPKKVSLRLPKKTNFRNLLQKAKSLVSEKRELWAPFEKGKMHPLIIVQELTNIIDKRRFDVAIDTISISEEEEGTKVEVEGFFKSKTGSDHFKYFFQLEKRFLESAALEPWDEKEENIISKPEDGKGIRFTAKLKLKEA